MSRPAPSSLRRQLQERSLPRIGTFIKTPSPHATEILGGLGFDFVVIDAEHAPFDRSTMDVVLLAAQAAGVPALVRVPELSAPHILAALDDGAAGVLVPHIDSVEKAQKLVALCRYAGKRGFSNSPRAGGYAQRGMWEHVDAADRDVVVVAMIEDPAAFDVIEAIVAVPGLDAIFVGRGDLTVSLDDRGQPAQQVARLTEQAINAAHRADKAVLIMANHAEEAADFQARGVAGFVVSSDQGFLRSAAAQALHACRSACAHAPIQAMPSAPTLPEKRPWP